MAAIAVAAHSPIFFHGQFLLTYAGFLLRPEIALLYNPACLF